MFISQKEIKVGGSAGSACFECIIAQVLSAFGHALGIWSIWHGGHVDGIL